MLLAKCDNVRRTWVGTERLSTRSQYWLLLPYLRPHRYSLGVGLISILGFVLTTPIIAALMGQIATDIGKGNMAALLRLPLIALILFSLRGIFQFGQDVMMAKAALNIALDLRRRVYVQLQTLNLDYFETAATGDLVYRLTEDVDRVGETIYKLFHQFLPCVLQLVAILGYMIYLNWQLTLATFLIAPLMALLIGWFGERLLRFSRDSQAHISDLSSLLTEVFGGIRLVKAFAAEEYEIQRFLQAAEKNRQAKFATERTKAIQYPVVGF
ncbi:MAG TPA: ABC transporter ATP-binding protein, partial [Stenomitos sp.]